MPRIRQHEDLYDEPDDWDSGSGWDYNHPLEVAHDEKRLWEEWQRDRCKTLNAAERYWYEL